MPGADLLFLPLPYAHAARGSAAAPNDDAPEAVCAAAIRSWYDAADACAAWQRAAEASARALRTIADLGDACARTSRLTGDSGRVSVDADAWRAYRMATIDAGAQVALDCETDEL